jgi:hypothetical protein
MMLAAGAVLIGVGVLLLTVEVSLFRATTQDFDFTGLTCGTPLDHPSWKTGEPCHGAVNRQTGATLLALLAGLSLVSVSTVMLLRERSSQLRDE